MLFSLETLTDEERRTIDRIDVLRQRLRHTTRNAKQWTGILRRAALARAIQGSNSIEGYAATFEDAVAAVVGEEPVEADAEVWAAVTGYRDAMTYVLLLADDPHFAYSEGLLRGLHFMMMRYDLGKHPGRWRPGAIYVRREPTGEIVYEGPGAETVPGLMGGLVAGLNRAGEMPALVRAALAHLNLAMIHPFADGNGRMARALQTLVLAREGILAPEFCSIEEYLGRNTEAYYAVLAQVGGGAWRPAGDPRPWVDFCLVAHFRQTAGLLHLTKEIERVWDDLERQVLRRRLPERTLLALADAALGTRVRNASYRRAAGISLNLASRDLKLLADAGLLVPKGERRGRYYVASDELRALRHRSATPPEGEEEEPFSTAPVHATEREGELGGLE